MQKNRLFLSSGGYIVEQVSLSEFEELDEDYVQTARKFGRPLMRTKS